MFDRILVHWLKTILNLCKSLMHRKTHFLENMTFYRLRVKKNNKKFKRSPINKISSNFLNNHFQMEWKLKSIIIFELYIPGNININSVYIPIILCKLCKLCQLVLVCEFFRHMSVFRLNPNLTQKVRLAQVELQNNPIFLIKFTNFKKYLFFYFLSYHFWNRMHVKPRTHVDDFYL